jgi:hypothetical protein
MTRGVAATNSPRTVRGARISLLSIAAILIVSGAFMRASTPLQPGAGCPSYFATFGLTADSICTTVSFVYRNVVVNQVNAQYPAVNGYPPQYAAAKAKCEGWVSEGLSFAANFDTRAYGLKRNNEVPHCSKWVAAGG